MYEALTVVSIDKPVRGPHWHALGGQQAQLPPGRSCLGSRDVSVEAVRPGAHTSMVPYPCFVANWLRAVLPHQPMLGRCASSAPR
jgi:hypothetical protein